MTIRVNGRTYEISTKQDLADMMREHNEDWYTVRMANRELLQLQYDLYLDELDRQDEKRSTGSYGKNAEVVGRIQHAIETGSRMYLHDVRCRGQHMDDQRIGRQRIEYKTGFAQWSYCESLQAGFEDLQRKASAGIIWHWDPFKDERIICMTLRDLLDLLAQYKPEKGLAVWFNFNEKKRQLQIQPVDLSAERRWWIEALIEGVDPRQYVTFRKAQRKLARQAAKDAE